MFIILSITASSLIFVIFKYFGVFKINSLNAIVVNYFTACALGLYKHTSPISLENTIYAPWFIGTLVLGILFISIFNAMAITSQNNGVSIASVASKMSVIIPICFGIILYNETLKPINFIGIILALAAVYLSSIRKDTIKNNANYLWPIIVFIGSGTIDTTIKYIETTYVPKDSHSLFSGTIFGVAAILGTLFLLTKKREKSDNLLKDVGAGITLGVINYYSIYFLLKALNTPKFDSSILFTVNNVGIVLLTTLIGLLLFKEPLSKKNYIGIGIAVISIILVSL